MWPPTVGAPPFGTSYAGGQSTSKTLPINNAGGTPESQDQAGGPQLHRSLSKRTTPPRRPTTYIGRWKLPPPSPLPPPYHFTPTSHRLGGSYVKSCVHTTPCHVISYFYIYTKMQYQRHEYCIWFLIITFPNLNVK